ncbi:MAG: hypothetical protein M0T76_00155 [Desulfobacteraceae bacterium]|nr:hypothetical protein [Desulfobacteraceae bacterium]
MADKENDFWPIEPNELNGFLQNNESVWCSYCDDSISELLQRSDLLVIAAEVKRLETAFPELTQAEHSHDEKVPSAIIAPPPDPAPAAKKSRRRHGVRTRMTLAVENARVVLIKSKKREPTTQAVFNLLANDDQTGTVVDQTKDRKGNPVLVWEDNDGRIHEISYRTVGNRLIEIRNRNKQIKE